MGELHLIKKACEEPQIGSVIFVHGLGGDAFGTWRHGDNDEASWPRWLADDVKNASVYSFNYDAAASAWLGATMPLFDRAKQLLAWLETIPDGPIVFVCHSMGGVLVKKALQCAQDGGSAAWAKIVRRTKGVAFLATPHTGSDLSDTMARLGKVLRATVSIEELKKSAPNLRELNEWYRNNSVRLGIATTSFYETRRIAGVLVVDESSADPGIMGAAPIPLDADHMSITKPETRSALQHVRLTSFVVGCFGKANNAKSASPSTNSGKSDTANPVIAQRSKLVISYKRGVDRDQQLARAIYGGLTASGHDVFIDVDTAVGVDWAVEIRERIVQCDYLIVLLSKQAAASEMVQAEVRLAHQCRKRDNKPLILPIRVDNDEPMDYELDAFLGRIQYLSWGGDQDTDAIITRLADRISATQRSDFRPSPSLDQLAAPTATPLSTNAARPSSSKDPRGLLPPGGSIKTNDGFYVRRDADEQIDALSRSSGQTLCIKAPRQMGKSSLLVRYVAQGKSLGKRLIWIDFQAFSESELSDFPALLCSLAHIFARQFGLKPSAGLRFESQRDFTHFFEDKLLAKRASPVVIGLDEVDRLLGRPYQSDFFSMLRLWHNARALPASVWENVDLALVIATEPYLLIAEADRSPFNVTPPIELRPFNRTELNLLSKAYEFPLDELQIGRLYDLLSGHPYLTRLALYRLLSRTGLTFAELLERAFNDDGPFGEHLRSKLFRLQQQGSLLTAMRSICSGMTRLDDDTYCRLHGAGLVVRRDGQVVPANLLYQKFFNQLR